MVWNFFRSRSTRDSESQANRSNQTSNRRATTRSSASVAPMAVIQVRSTRVRSSLTPPVTAPPLMAERPRLDPESNPLSGVSHFSASSAMIHSSSTQYSSPSVNFDPTIAKITPIDPNIEREPRNSAKLGPILQSNIRGDDRENIQKSPKRIGSASHSIRSVSSLRSIRSGSHSSNRSIRSASGTISLRARYTKAAIDAKRASTRYLAAHSDVKLLCYTCGCEFRDGQCAQCLTTYGPPDFKYSASSAARLESLVEPLSPKYDNSASTMSKFTNSRGNVLQTTSAASISENSSASATMFWGFYPEMEESDAEPTNKLDLELIIDLAASGESGLLESVLFEGFCSVETIVQAFSSAAFPLDCSPQTGSDDEAPDPVVDIGKIQQVYSALTSMSSTIPMRGILQGAQSVLLHRNHEPLTDKEMIYVIVVMLCPAITDCSMFTKITGPMQKLAKYSSLRSRARVILEICSGLLTHTSEDLNRVFMRVMANCSIKSLSALVDLCNGYISHRLSFDYHYKSGCGNRPNKFEKVKYEWYVNDWRIAVVVKFLALLWGANSLVHKSFTGLPISQFYNTMIDLVDLTADYDSWQSRSNASRRRFCFCRYPFLLSAGSKARILLYVLQKEINRDIQQQMFSYLSATSATHSQAAQDRHIARLHFVTLKIRRNYLFEDSVNQLLKWPAAKKRWLKITFNGEFGIDAGGLKREWFLLFYRSLIEPNVNLFTIDDTSNYAWFRRDASLDICYVAGMTLGLAIHSSVTIDCCLPPLLFKILLNAPYDLNDVGALWPEITQSFQSILDYADDDFESVFGLTFTAPDDTPLIIDGDKLPVTFASREAYVDLAVEYFVNSEGPPVQKFKEGFLSVCENNAITLFRPEELEHLVKGDRQPFDVATLRSVTKYVNFGGRYNRANREPVVVWFWDYFERLNPAGQARLLQFITASDCPPAAGVIQMRFSILCLGDDSDRLPIAHTCFNQIGLYRYRSRSKLEKKLSLAIQEYQGFGLK